MRFFFLIPVLLIGSTAQAALIETSLTGSWARSHLSEDYNSTQQRLSGSIEFKFTPVSGLQFEYTDSRTHASFNTQVNTGMTREEIGYNDKVYSFNLVQNLVPANWIIQPYVKFGGGRLDRVYTTEFPQYNTKITVTQRTNTGVAGAGLRIFLLRNLAIKGEFNTYVPDFQFKQWKDNELFSTGLSWLF